MSTFLYLLASLFTAGLCHKGSHDCIHNEISRDHGIHQQHVKYKYDPLGKDQNNHQRDLLQDDDITYEPIRIRPYYNPDYINNSTLTNDQVAYIKSLTSAAIHQLESFISVQPVDGPLFLDRCPPYFYYQPGAEFVYPVCHNGRYEDYEPRTCGLTTIPDDHFSDAWAYNTSTGESKLYKQGGNGIADTDLIVYVTFSDTSCGERTLAYASPCDLDQYGRPVAGAINFCPRAIGDDPYWKVCRIFPTCCRCYYLLF